VIIIPADIRIVFFAHFVECPFPQVIDKGQHVGLADEGQGVFFADAAGFFTVFAGVFKGVFQTAIHLIPAINSRLGGYFIRCAFHHQTAGAGIDVAGVFTNDGVIDFFGAFILDGAIDAGQKTHRTQVDILIQRKSHSQQQAFFQNPRLDIRVADGAQQNGVMLLQLINGAVRQHFAGTFVAFAAEIIIGLFSFKAELGRRSVHDLHRLDCHFRPGAVAADDCDFIRLHKFYILS